MMFIINFCKDYIFTASFQSSIFFPRLLNSLNAAVENARNEDERSRRRHIMKVSTIGDGP